MKKSYGFLLVLVMSLLLLFSLFSLLMLEKSDLAFHLSDNNRKETERLAATNKNIALDFYMQPQLQKRDAR